MDGVSFAFSAISLAIELFDQSVTAYKLFIEGKELEKTSTHFTAKLAIEERRLIQWGEGSGFNRTSDTDSEIEGLGDLGVDSRLLRNDALSDVVTRTLTCIKDVLYDVDLLTKRYGLKISKPSLPSEDADGDGAEKPTAKDTQITVAAPLRFTKASISPIARFKWAVKDKDGFGKFLEQLKYYNDSLYSLLPVEIGITITRDVLASLVGSASDETLLQFRSLGRKEEKQLRRSSGGKGASYKGISSVASVALKIRYQSVKEGAVTVVPRSEIHRDGTASRLATWEDCAGKEVRIFLDNKTGVRFEGHGQDSKVSENVNLLASLLNRTTSAQEFSSMRCLGITHLNRQGPTMLYELPPGTDLIAEPMTLHELLAMTDDAPSSPTLDDRFELAKAIAGAIYQMHSAGWMHKDISSHNIVFFKSTAPPDEGGLYNLKRPYLKGFRFSRRVSMANSDSHDSYHGFFGDRHHESGRINAFVDKKKKEHENARLLQESIYQHPSYLFHKLISEVKSEYYSLPELMDYQTHNKRETYYTLRHEYYSLGLLLLEIGLWKPLESMDLLHEPVAPTGIWDIRISFSLTYEFGMWEDRDLNGRMATAMKTMRASRSRIPREPSSNEKQVAWPAELEAYIQSLRSAMTEEKITGVVLRPSSAAKPGNDESFWSLWDEVYPHAVLRNDSAGFAKKSLGQLMGRRYRDIVVRCLNSDFSINQMSEESKWLRAFNWLIVKELENCYV